MQNADDYPPKPDAAYRSRWGRFSPSMGWKAFWSEIVIVTLGVLIALAANEAVQNWNWRHKVQDGEARLKLDVEDAFNVAAESVAVAPCVDAQLVAIAATLLKDGNTLQPLPRYSDHFFSNYVVRYPDRPFGLPVWDTLIADGTAIRIPDSRRKRYQQIHSQLSNLKEDNASTSTARGRFAVMAYPIMLDTVVRKDLLIEIEEQRSRYRSMALVASQIMQEIDNLHLAPKSEQVDISNQESGTVKFCKAQNLPLSDWRDALKQ